MELELNITELIYRFYMKTSNLTLSFKNNFLRGESLLVREYELSEKFCVKLAAIASV